MRATFCRVSACVLLIISACSSAPRSPQPRELHIFNWEDYFAPDTLENFEAEHGVKVMLETFGSEEEMLAGIQSRPGGYDAVVASGSMVETLIQLKLLSILSLDNISNFANIRDDFRSSPFDPENRYSVPYLWGTTGLAINKKYVPADASTWEVLWTPAYKRHLAMLNDPQEVLGAALLALGHSLNDRDPELLEEARQKLLAQRPLLAGYLDPISLIEGLASEEIWAAQLYSGDALTAKEKNPNVIYLLPREGAALWMDHLVVPVGASHKEEAELFINYLLQPQVAGDIVNYLYYSSPNREATRYINPEILEEPSIYPEAEALSRLHYYQPLDAETNQWLNRLWAELVKP